MAKQYVPGVSEVDRKRGLLRQTSAAFDQNDQTDSDSQSDVFKADDGKWRPVVVTLGIPVQKGRLVYIEECCCRFDV